tara:strand:+ start:803 stop:970 length:168 start_codon:yes stop_codon:yes gene_type:complete
MIEIKLTLPEEQVEEFLSQWQQLLADVEKIKKDQDTILKMAILDRPQTKSKKEKN